MTAAGSRPVRAGVAVLVLVGAQLSGACAASSTVPPATQEQSAAVRDFANCAFDTYLGMYGMTDRRLRVKLTMQGCLPKMERLAHVSDDYLAGKIEMGLEADLMSGKYDYVHAATTSGQ